MSDTSTTQEKFNSTLAGSGEVRKFSSGVDGVLARVVTSSRGNELKDIQFFSRDEQRVIVTRKFPDLQDGTRVAGISEDDPTLDEMIDFAVAAQSSLPGNELANELHQYVSDRLQAAVQKLGSIGLPSAEA